MTKEECQSIVDKVTHKLSIDQNITESELKSSLNAIDHLIKCSSKKGRVDLKYIKDYISFKTSREFKNYLSIGIV